MKFLLKNIFIRLLNRIRAFYPAWCFSKNSFSQAGEDIIVSFLLDIICGSKEKKYLDIGASHPFKFSNTLLLYKNGGSGTLVEPDPFYASMLRKKRPRDKVLQCGVHHLAKKEADFYLLNSSTLNTFSKKEMLRCLQMGHSLRKIIKVEVKNINEILESVGEFDFLNIDIEGLDLNILKMIDWVKYRPKCVCVETVIYEKNKKPKKLSNIAKLMHNNGYILFADTFINSIFVDKRHW